MRGLRRCPQQRDPDCRRRRCGILERDIDADLCSCGNRSLDDIGQHKAHLTEILKAPHVLHPPRLERQIRLDLVSACRAD